MSCLSALGSQIFAFVSEPREVLSLQHQVLQEYGKVALGPDFSHTFPSLIIIIAVCIALCRYLKMRWWSINSMNSFLRELFKIFCSWIIMNATLWYWLILQRVLYCTVWIYWTNDRDIREIYLPWWRKVWSSFNPPTAPPPVLSASLISWILTMILASIALLGAIFADKISFSVRCSLLNIRKSTNEINMWKKSTLQRERIAINNGETEEEIEITDKSDNSSSFDENRSEESSLATNRKITQWEISPISYDANQIIPTGSRKKSQYEASCKTLKEVAECLMSEDNFVSRPLRNKRNCHT